jgi:prepilin signal peptidase PulO-like enzyme (type II secretory pathway)
MINLFFLYFLIFILGSAFASFIAVYVERGSVWGRSMCANCLKKLNIFELVPVFSYIFLQGKCRTCKTKISGKLFLGEIALGLYFLASYFFFLNFEYNLLFILASFSLGTIFFLLVLEDLESMEVSSIFVYLVFVLGFVGMLLHIVFGQNSFLQAVLPLLLFSPFWLLYFINKNYIGEADPFIFSGVGLFYGLQFSLTLFMYTAFFGSVFGVLYLMFINKKFERGIKLPLLPIIFFSTLFILIFNYHILKIEDILVVNDFILGKV